MVFPGHPSPPGVLPGSPLPSGGARHRRAGSPTPWRSLRWPSSATHTPRLQGGQLRSPGGRRARPSRRPNRPWPQRNAGPPPLTVLAPPWPLRQPRRFCARPPRSRGGRYPRRFRPWLPCRGGGVLRGVAVYAAGRLAGGLGGLGGDHVPHVRVDVVDGLVILVGVVPRHLLDTGGDGQTSGCRGSPPPIFLSSGLPSLPRPCALSCLPSLANVALPLIAPQPPPCPSSRVPALSHCCLHWRPARYPALSRHRKRPGPSFVSVSCTAACSFALPWRSSSFSAYHPPPVPLRPWPRAPLAGTPPLLIAAPPLLDHAPLQLRQGGARRRALGRRGADGPRLPLGEGGLLRVRLGRAHVGVAGLGVGAVTGALPAFCCGQRRARGRGVAARGGGRGPLRTPGPLSGAGRQEQRPGRRGRPPRPALVLGLAVQGRWGPPWAARLAALPVPQPPPAAAPRALRGFPRASRGDRGGGAEPAVVAVVPLGGPIGVRHRCQSGGDARLQACPSHYLTVHRWCALGSAVRCWQGGGSWLWWWFWAIRGQWRSTGTGAGGWRATRPTRRATLPSPGGGSGP